MTAVARFLFITIDAQDAKARGLLGGDADTELDEELDEGRFLVLKERQGLPTICIQRVPEPKQGKVRIHLDLGATDLEEATARILELGGAWDGQEQTLEGVPWRTFTDPEGHEFDVIKTRS